MSRTRIDACSTRVGDISSIPAPCASVPRSLRGESSSRPARRAARASAALLVGAGSLLAGCGGAGITRPENPSFATPAKEASASLKEMAQAPRALERPLVILAGYGDPGLGPWLLEHRLRGAIQTSDAAHGRRVLHVGFAFNTSFEGCRRKVVDAVERAFPCDDPARTSEVDVIGISLGGVVARYAALAPMPPAAARATQPAATRPAKARPHDAKRLRIARLFTISSPHRGAIQADQVPALTPLHADLRTGSDFLKRLEAATASADYTLYPYVRLGDKTIGVDNAAPAGRSPYWLPNLPWEIAHGQAWCDPRILADIARRLRGEPPLAVDPPAPLPDTAHAERPARHS
jgi:hypothetical protein